jgi:hypothetical protein
MSAGRKWGDFCVFGNKKVGGTPPLSSSLVTESATRNYEDIK